jgi:hypothetical protein
MSNGFSYVVGEGDRIDVAFYETDNLSGHDGPWNSADPYGGGITDIWDALRVNEPGAPGLAEDKSLEIAIDEDTAFFGQPIDVVYVPMSHMVWKGEANDVVEALD